MTLKEYKELFRVTDTQLAEAFGCHRTLVNKIINGRAVPSLGLANRILRETGGLVSQSDLIKWEEWGV